MLLPEIAGFSPGLLRFAERLIETRFRIFVPWLFGPLGMRAPFATDRLNVSDGEIAEARARLDAGWANLLAVRCWPDRIGPRAKIERLRRVSDQLHYRLPVACCGTMCVSLGP